MNKSKTFMDRWGGGNKCNRLLFQNEIEARKVDTVITVVVNKKKKRKKRKKEYKSSLLS